MINFRRILLAEEHFHFSVLVVAIKSCLPTSSPAPNLQKSEDVRVLTHRKLQTHTKRYSSNIRRKTIIIFFHNFMRKVIACLVFTLKLKLMSTEIPSDVIRLIRQPFHMFLRFLFLSFNWLVGKLYKEIIGSSQVLKIFSNSQKTSPNMIAGAQPRIFGEREGFHGWGHFDTRFMYDIQKKGSAGKSFSIFSPRCS